MEFKLLECFLRLLWVASLSSGFHKYTNRNVWRKFTRTIHRIFPKCTLRRQKIITPLALQGVVPLYAAVTWYGNFRVSLLTVRWLMVNDLQIEYVGSIIANGTYWEVCELANTSLYFPFSEHLAFSETFSVSYSFWERVHILEWSTV